VVDPWKWVMMTKDDASSRNGNSKIGKTEMHQKLTNENITAYKLS
jgi:hypothetical protein